MFIKDTFFKKKPLISCEIFPPKKQAAVETIMDTIRSISELRPDFISVTYGAGGSGNSGLTTSIAAAVKNDCGVEVLAHLTSIMATRETILHTLQELKSNHIQNIMALRGDIPAGFTGNVTGDYPYAKDLIREIKAFGGFSIGAAAYPEGHIDCDNTADNYTHLLEKQQAGADFLITQLFFDNAMFYTFLEKARAAGVTLPIVPGIMPMLSKGQIERMIFTCGTSLPSRMIRLLHKYENDPKSLEQAGIDYACEQVEDLLKHDVDGVHIYTMNKPYIAEQCMRRVQPLVCR